MYKYKKEQQGFSVEEFGTKTWFNSNCEVVVFARGGNISVEISGPIHYTQQYAIAGNTVHVNDVLFSGTAAQLAELLNNEVFLKPNSGSGGSGSVVLQSPDNAQWLLAANNSGALVTTKLAEPVAAVQALTLTAPNGSRYSVTVNNAGALTTTSI